MLIQIIFDYLIEIKTKVSGFRRMRQKLQRTIHRTDHDVFVCDILPAR